SLFLSLSKKSFIFTLFLCPSPFNNICWFNITAFLYLFLSFFFILCHFSKKVSFLVSTSFKGPSSLTCPYSDRKCTRLNSSHVSCSYAVSCWRITTEC